MTQYARTLDIHRRHRPSGLGHGRASTGTSNPLIISEQSFALRFVSKRSMKASVSGRGCPLPLEAAHHRVAEKVITSVRPRSA